MVSYLLAYLKKAVIMMEPKKTEVTNRLQNVLSSWPSAYVHSVEDKPAEQPGFGCST